MRRQRNRIQQFLAVHDIPQWMLAKEMQISESYFSRLMRDPDEEFEKEALLAAEKIATSERREW